MTNTPMGHDEQGATAIEYALIASLIAVAILASVLLVGERLGAAFDEIAVAVSL
jgi:pilus assembly protein Flp/PilA